MNRRKEAPHAPVEKLAVIGNHLPRQCGIATFTADLCAALRSTYPELELFVLPLNDRPEGYRYPDPVRFEIHDRDLDAYCRAADFLNLNDVDVVSVQHEFGIYGGEAGDYLLALLRDLTMPVVTTLHTVLRDPDRAQRRVMRALAERSDRLVVMSEKGAGFLREIYRVDPDRIDVIPHGVPDLPFQDSSFHKDRFGVEGRQVLLTFGLLSPGKGIEYAIEALPAIVERHPEAIYLVVGATHPNVRAEQGEAYRQHLQNQAERLGVQAHVVFDNRFVEFDELCRYIGASDIYLTPYLGEAQITSGTLAYAIGAGKAVVSTPYWYAEEMLAEGRGRLVPFRDAGAIAGAVNELLDDEVARGAMRKRAYQFGRDMVWGNVARAYDRSFARARTAARRGRRDLQLRTVESERPSLPPVVLDHLIAMTDDTGLIQHADHAVPDYHHGYSIDDNARGLILASLLADERRELARHSLPLARRYLAFINYAWNRDSRRFRNFLGYDRRWREEAGSEDSHARTLQALGSVLGRDHHPGLRGLAARLFTEALSPVEGFTSPRSWAFALIGIHEYLRRFAGDREANRLRELLAERLHRAWRDQRRDDWPWFEPVLSYSNAALPRALLMAGYWTGHPEWKDAALESLDWLARAQTADDGTFEPVGCAHAWRRGEAKPRFDQQPVEAYASCVAYGEAFGLTGDERWHRETERAYAWFLGRNALGIPLYDSATGACHDGLHSDRINANQGAESTLAALIGLLEMTRIRRSMLVDHGDAEDAEDREERELSAV